MAPEGDELGEGVAGLLPARAVGRHGGRGGRPVGGDLEPAGHRGRRNKKTKSVYFSTVLNLSLILTFQIVRNY